MTPPFAMPIDFKFEAALPSAELAETAEVCAYSVAVGFPLLSERLSEITPALPIVALSARVADVGSVKVWG